MAMTRKALKAMGLSEEQIDSIIDMHTETVDGLREQVRTYKDDAEKLPGVQKQLDELKKGDGEDWKGKYDAEKAAHDKTKSDYAAKENAAKVKGAYRAMLKEAGVAEKYLDTVIRATDLSGMKIAIDSANGATSSYAADMFRALGADVFVLSNTPDGRNINENCGSTHPEELFKAVAAGDFHVGFAYDGDGDRLIACDEKGTEMDGDDILAILALTLKNRGQLYDNTLVVTVMSNLGLELYCKDQGISVIRTAVGDRYIMEEMRKSGYNLGGEQSGHIIIRDILPTGDGMLTSLFLAAALKEKGGSMSELSSAMAKMPQVLINVKVKNKEGLKTNQTVLNAIRGGEEQLAGRGRILVRPSGTEPKVRVMVEGEDAAAIRSIEVFGGYPAGRTARKAGQIPGEIPVTKPDGVRKREENKLCAES